MKTITVVFIGFILIFLGALVLDVFKDDYNNTGIAMISLGCVSLFTAFAISQNRKEI